jgi:hypothetical protein
MPPVFLIICSFVYDGPDDNLYADQNKNWYLSLMVIPGYDQKQAGYYTDQPTNAPPYMKIFADRYIYTGNKAIPSQSEWLS